jgi:hypothetical protein
MEDRIQINGVWYTREDNQPTQEIKPLNREDITAFKGFVYDINGFSYEATKIAKSGLFEEDESLSLIDICNKIHYSPADLLIFKFRKHYLNNPET